MIRTLVTLGLFAIPTAVFADSQLDRLESVSERTNELMMVKMVEAMVAETGADPAPVMALIPDMEWDDAFRVAGECMLDGYRAEIGKGGVDEMLDLMEDMLPKLEEQSLEEMGEEMNVMPEGLTMEASIGIQQECGMMELAMERMSETGFMEAMFSAATGTE